MAVMILVYNICGKVVKWSFLRLTRQILLGELQLIEDMRPAHLKPLDSSYMYREKIDVKWPTRFAEIIIRRQMRLNCGFTATRAAVELVPPRQWYARYTRTASPPIKDQGSSFVRGARMIDAGIDTRTCFHHVAPFSPICQVSFLLSRIRTAPVSKELVRKNPPLLPSSSPSKTKI